MQYTRCKQTNSQLHYMRLTCAKRETHTAQVLVITDLLRFKQQRLALEFVRCRMNLPNEPD